jgi:xanthine dehydrogenase YagS FAD-binding subunit
MKQFEYLTAASFEAAAKAMNDADDAVAKAAGTDLLELMKDRVVEPTQVVNLLRVQDKPGQNEIGATATLAQVADAGWIRESFPAVAKAAADAATPQIRNVGTLGGNLAQMTRCPYFRSATFPCYKRGSGECPPLEKGYNKYNAIFPHKKCACAHPSNLAPALIAVGAKVKCVHPDGDRIMDAGLLYRDPKAGRHSDTVLRAGELITSIVLEPTALAKNSTYLEFRERQSFDFALVSVAAAVEMEGGKVKDARIVCGAVAPTPYRATAAENALKGKALDPEAAAEAAVKDAQPLSGNKYKVVILKRLIRRALEELK